MLPVRRMRLMCLNMALSKQWRRISVIYAAWVSLARQRSLQRKGIMRITSRRFYCIMRIYLGVWWTFSKNSYRRRVLLVLYCPTNPDPHACLFSLRKGAVYA